MGFFNRDKDQIARDKVRKREGFRPATDAEIWGSFADLRAQMKSLAPQGRLAEFDAIYRHAVQTRDQLPTGRRVYEYLVGWVTDHEPQDTAAALAAFEHRYRETQSPMWAGVYATVLTNAAYLARGGGYAHEVTKDGRQTMIDLLSRAADVLDESAAGGRDEFPWLHARQLNAMNLGDRDELSERFEALYALDRGNLNTLSARGVQLMPRWYGLGPEDAEQFARRAVEDTYEEFGYGAYSAVYSVYPNTADLDASDTLVDPALLKRSFEDLYARFGGLRLRNEFACAMDWVGDHATVRAIFDAPLREIDRASWTSGDAEKWGMEYAIAAYITAKHG